MILKFGDTPNVHIYLKKQYNKNLIKLPNFIFKVQTDTWIQERLNLFQEIQQIIQKLHSWAFISLF